MEIDFLIIRPTKYDAWAGWLSNKKKNKDQHIISECDAPITTNRQWFQCHRSFQEKDIGFYFFCAAEALL